MGHEAKNGGRVERNVVVMVISLIGNYAASFATFPYLTRVLGPEHFGVLAYATSIAAYGALFSEWGFSLSGPRAVVACRTNPEKLNELIWSVIGAKALICGACTALLFFLVGFTVDDSASKSAILIAWTGVIANVCTVYWLFQGVERFKLIAVLVFSNRLVTVPLTFVLVRQQGDICTAAAIQAAGPIVAAIVSLAIAKKEGYLGKPVFRILTILRYLRDGVDMFVATASVTLFGAANSIILMHFSGPYAAGVYAGADKIRVVANLVPSQISTVVYPRVERLFKTSKRSASRLIVYGAIATTIVSICAVLVVVVDSHFIVRLVLGKGYDGAASVLVTLGLAAIFGNLAYFIGLQILVPTGASKLRSASILVAGVLNIALSLVMVPRFGAMGAAHAFLISEALIFCLYLMLVFRNSRSKRVLSLFRAHLR